MIELEKGCFEEIVRSGFYVLDIPKLNDKTIRDALLGFMRRNDLYKRQYLQHRYGYAFDGYSFQGQKDSSNQSSEDLVSTFVISDFHSPDKFPEEFQRFFEREWHPALEIISDVERQLADLIEPQLGNLYATLGHMVSCNYYPRVKMPDKSTRLTSHNDISLFTVFPFGLPEGLEYLDNEGQWRPVPATDKMMIFGGYLLEYWSGGEIKGFKHRVAIPEDRNDIRMSFAFFSLPPPDITLAMKDGREVTSAEYFDQYLGQFE